MASSTSFVELVAGDPARARRRRPPTRRWSCPPRASAKSAPGFVASAISFWERTAGSSAVTNWMTCQPKADFTGARSWPGSTPSAKIAAANAGSSWVDGSSLAKYGSFLAALVLVPATLARGALVPDLVPDPWRLVSWRAASLVSPHRACRARGGWLGRRWNSTPRRSAALGQHERLRRVALAGGDRRPSPRPEATERSSAARRRRLRSQRRRDA